MCLIGFNVNIVFGKKYNFSSISILVEYVECVFLNIYDDLWFYIE